MCVMEPGTFRPVINKDNDYLIDRAAQKRGETYCGVKGIAMQDAVGAGKHGPDPGPLQGEPRLDRQRHHHGAASPAAGPRRDLKKASRRPDLRRTAQRVRSATFVLPVDVPFAEAKREDLTVREGVPHTSI